MSVKRHEPDNVRPHATEVVRACSQFSFGAALVPYSDSVTFDTVPAYRTAPLPQWFVERDNFEEDVRKGYASLACNEPRQLVAGTGVGKSTTLPACIASSGEEVGIVVCPENTLAFLTHAYVKSYVMRKYPGVESAVLRSEHYLRPLSSPALYYTSGAELLAHMASKKSFLSTLGVTFIYLDESHTMRPDYLVFIRLASTVRMPRVKIFYGSATVASDMSLEGGGVGRTVIQKPSTQFPIKTPDMTPAGSPLHYAFVSARTMVFLPTDADVENWTKYYDQHDVLTIALRNADGTNALVDALAECAKHKCFVFLVTARMQTGYTIELDVVVDCGYTQVFRYGDDCVSGSLQVRPVTAVERVQRAGRVGRHRPGTVYQNAVQCAPQDKPNTVEITFYEYLWYIVFCMDVKDQSIARFDALTGGLTRYAAALLLNMRVPALLVLPYVGNLGYYKGFGLVLRNITYTGTNVVEEEKNVDKAMAWPERNTGPRYWLDKPRQFQSLTAFPREWEVIPYVLWETFMDQSFVKRFAMNLDNRSVASAVSRSKKSDYAPSAVPVARRAELKDNRKLSFENDFADIKSSMKSRSSIISDKFNDAFGIRRVANVAKKPVPLLMEGDSGSSESEEDATSRAFAKTGKKDMRVGGWIDMLPEPRITRAASSSSGSGEHDKAALSLKRINPHNYKNHKFYPMDEDILGNYLAHVRANSNTVSATDVRRVKRLLDGKELFGTMDLGGQTDYFMSVVHVHNLRVAAKLQMRSAGERDVAGRMIIKLRGISIESSESLITDTVSLLKMMEYESFFVGVDRRSIQVATEDAAYSPVFEGEQTRAKVSLAFGDLRIATIVNDLMHCVHSFKVNGVHKGHYVQNADLVYMTDHMYAEYSGKMPPQLSQAVVSRESEQYDLIVISIVETKERINIRAPVSGERVYVIAYDAATHRMSCYGDYLLEGETGLWTIDFVFTYGFSGALIVSMTDGFALAINCGRYDELECVEYSRVTPLVGE